MKTGYFTKTGSGQTLGKHSKTEHPAKAEQALKMLMELSKEEDEDEPDAKEGGGGGKGEAVDHSHLDFSSHEELWAQSTQYHTLLEEERAKAAPDRARQIQLLQGKAMNEQVAGKHEEVLRDVAEILTLQVRNDKTNLLISCCITFLIRIKWTAVLPRQARDKTRAKEG